MLQEDDEPPRDVLDELMIYPAARRDERSTSDAERGEETGDRASLTPTLAELVAASYVNAPITPPLSAPQSMTAVTPIQPLPVLEETPWDRARREWDQFQVWRLNNLGEPGNALGSGARNAAANYNPFWETPT
jgi:hypothetical protein